VFLDFGVHERVVMSVQASEGGLVVSAYQAAVADHIGHKNGRQSPLDTLALQGHLLPPHAGSTPAYPLA